ncbi:MAG: VOC family protein [Bryobacteraceae bacterium]
MRLRTAMLYVKDLRGMTEFYESLGFSLIEKSSTETYVEFDTGGTRFALHSIPPSVAAGIEIASPRELREETPLKLILEAQDLSSELDRLKGLGVTLIRRPWGSWDGVDPEGNIFGLSAPRK